jgi:HEPN domain-containing protein
MMHNPYPEGEIFKAKETQFIKMSWQTMKSCSSVVAKWDIAYTRNKTSDYNAVPIIGFKQDRINVFKTYCRQSLMSEVLDWMYDIDKQAKKHNISIEWYAERQFWNEPVKEAVEAAAKRYKYYLEIVMDDTPQTNKIKRIIKGLASYWQMSKIYFNEAEKESYDMKTGLGQLWAVDYSYTGKDDFPDALEATVAKGKRSIIAQDMDYTMGRNEQVQGLY